MNNCIIANELAKQIKDLVKNFCKISENMEEGTLENGEVLFEFEKEIKCDNPELVSLAMIVSEYFKYELFPEIEKTILEDIYHNFKGYKFNGSTVLYMLGGDLENFYNSFPNLATNCSYIVSVPKKALPEGITMLTIDKNEKYIYDSYISLYSNEENTFHIKFKIGKKLEKVRGLYELKDSNRYIKAYKKDIDFVDGELVYLPENTPVREAQKPKGMYDFYIGSAKLNNLDSILDNELTTYLNSYISLAKPQSFKDRKVEYDETIDDFFFLEFKDVVKLDRKCQKIFIYDYFKNYTDNVIIPILKNYNEGFRYNLVIKTIEPDYDQYGDDYNYLINLKISKKD